MAALTCGGWRGYAGRIEFTSGHRTRQTRGIFMPGIRPVQTSLWRDDRPEYNTLRGNTARASCEARLSPATLISGGLIKFARRSFS